MVQAELQGHKRDSSQLQTKYKYYCITNKLKHEVSLPGNGCCPGLVEKIADVFPYDNTCICSALEPLILV